MYIYIYIIKSSYIILQHHLFSIHCHVWALRVDPWILPGGNAILGVDEIPRWKSMATKELPWSYHGMEALKMAMCLFAEIGLGLTSFNQQNSRI